MAINFEELDLIVKEFKAFPETHIQAVWLKRIEEGDEYTPDGRTILKADWCGTACCVAGKAVLRAGWEPEWDSALTSGNASGIVREGIKGDVKAEAQKILGITYDQAEELFGASNTIEDIERIIDEWRAAE